MSNNVEIRIGNRTRKVATPESWDDLDLRTMAVFYSSFFTGVGDEYTAGIFTAVKLISMTQHILGFSPDMMAKWEADALRQDPENGDLVFLEELKQVIIAVLSGLLEIQKDVATGATTYAVKYNRTKCPWPALSHTARQKGKKPGKTTWYYAPKDGLDNLTLYELSYTFAIYEEYVDSMDEAKANELIGILYRPSRPETQEERDSEIGRAHV